MDDGQFDMDKNRGLKQVLLDDSQIQVLKDLLSQAKISVGFGEEAANWHELGMGTMRALNDAEDYDPVGPMVCEEAHA